MLSFSSLVKKNSVFFYSLQKLSRRHSVCFSHFVLSAGKKNKTRNHSPGRVDIGGRVGVQLQQNRQAAAGTPEPEWVSFDLLPPVTLMCGQSPGLVRRTEMRILVIKRRKHRAPPVGGT